MISPTARSVHNGIMLTTDPFNHHPSNGLILKDSRNEDRSIMAFNISILFLICEGDGCQVRYFIRLTNVGVPISTTHFVSVTYRIHSAKQGFFSDVPTRYILFWMTLVLEAFVAGFSYTYGSSWVL